MGMSTGLFLFCIFIEAFLENVSCDDISVGSEKIHQFIIAHACNVETFLRASSKEFYWSTVQSISTFSPPKIIPF